MRRWRSAGIALLVTLGCAPPEYDGVRAFAGDLYEDLDGDGLPDVATLYQRSLDGGESMWLSFRTGVEFMYDGDSWSDEVPVGLGASILGVVDVAGTPTLVIRDSGSLHLAHWNGAAVEVRPSSARYELSANEVSHYGEAPERWIAIHDSDERRVQMITPTLRGDDVTVSTRLDPDTLPPTRDQMKPRGSSLYLRPEAGDPVAWADIDGDGDLDVFSQRRERLVDEDSLEESLTVTGYISFARGDRWSKPIKTHWSRLGALVDFDGDGAAEVVVQSGTWAHVWSFGE